MRPKPERPDTIRYIDWEYYFDDLATWTADRTEPLHRQRLFTDEELFGEQEAKYKEHLKNK